MSIVSDDKNTPNTTPTLEQQKNYWKFWQGTRSCSEWALERAGFVLRLIGELPLRDPRILELGCGTGWFTERLAGFGATTGIDLNDEAMRDASVRCPHINFIGSNIFEYPFEPNSFDLVVSMQVIAHVENQPSFMQRVANVLKPGGYCIITTNNKFVMDRLGDSDWGSHRSAGHIENWLTISELKKLVAPHFQVMQTRTLIPMGNGGVLRIVNSAKLNAFLEYFIPVTYLRQTKERLGFGYYIVIVARKPVSNG